MDNPKISVIVPVYKVEKYLDKCLQSIVNQTYKNLEIILVDDGSPDSCPAMCDEWADKDRRIKVIHKENGGVSSARNAGLDAAEGEYIGFVDSDDWIEPNMYEVLISNAISCSADKTMCDFFIFGQLNDKYDLTISNTEVFTEKKDILLRAVSGENNAMWRSIYSSKAINGIRFDETLTVAEDWLFNYAVCKHILVEVAVDARLYHYEDNLESAMHNITRKKILDRSKVLEYIWKNESGNPVVRDVICDAYINAFMYGDEECIREGLCSTRWYRRKVKRNMNEKLSILLRSNISIIRKIKIALYTLAHPVYVTFVRHKLRTQVNKKGEDGI